MSWALIERNGIRRSSSFTLFSYAVMYTECESFILSSPRNLYFALICCVNFPVPGQRFIVRRYNLKINFNFREHAENCMPLFLSSGIKKFLRRIFLSHKLRSWIEGYFNFGIDGRIFWSKIAYFFWWRRRKNFWMS